MGRLDTKRAAAFVFKTERRPRGERLAHIRLFSGALKEAPLAIIPSGEALHVRRLVRLLGSEEIEVPSLRAGSVGALHLSPDGPRLRTGQTLTAPRRQPLRLNHSLTPSPSFR